MENFSQTFVNEGIAILQKLDLQSVEDVAAGLASVREGQNARLFILGVGGSAGHASHAVNDFRKICGFEAYTPTDNASELTARINDEGWDTVFAAWLRISRLNDKDALFILSVGGGDAERNVSANLVQAIKEAKLRGAKVFGVVGRATGYTAQVGDAVVVVPVADPARVTPHSEAVQAVVWQCLVSNPILQIKGTKWESVMEARP